MAYDESFKPAGRLPGANLADVMWSLEDNRFNVMDNPDDIARGEMAGYNTRVVGKIRELFPRLSQADYERVKLTQLPEAPEGMAMLLDRVSGLPTRMRNNLIKTRRLAVQQQPDGTERYIVVPVAPVVEREVDVLDMEQGFNELAKYQVPSEEDLAGRKKVRTYALNQLFDDESVGFKYGFPARVIETARRQAVTNPAVAAKSMQDFMNAQQDKVKVIVTAPRGPMNKALASSTLRTVGAEYPRTNVAVESEVAMDMFFMFGPAGRDDWHVRGPLKYANEISFVYWMMFHAGRVFPNILYSLELVVLGIDVFDGVSSREPEIVFHSGVALDIPVGLSEDTKLELSVAQRVEMESFGARMLPVLANDGLQMATAVQVTGRHAVVNAHVTSADPSCQLQGAVLDVKRQLARDMLCVRSVMDAPPWVLRAPVVSEWVTICYLADGRVSCTRPVQVVATSEDVLVLTMDSTVGPGFSGGAVVALTDLALLGIHSGATRNNLLAYRFGDQQFADLLESDSVSMVSRADDPGEFAAKTVEYFKNRGLGGVFRSAVASLEAVYVDNVHIGSAVRSGGKLYTTCDPHTHLTFGASRTVHVLDRVGKSPVYCARDGAVVASPAYRRPPTYYERVFVIGFDGEPYLSTATEVAHIGPGHSNFVIRDLPGADRSLVGGLVMAFDGAFLGICGSRRVDTAIGLGFTCWPVHDEGGVVQGPREVLARSFPFLNLQAWPDALLEEVFTHASVGKYASGRVFNVGCKPLANIGDAVLKTLMWTELRRAAVPHSTWQSRIQAVQSNAYMSEVAWTQGYAKALVVGTGASFSRESKAYADLTEALVGAASLVEDSKTLRTLALTMKLIEAPEPYPIVATPGYFGLARTEGGVIESPAVD